MYFLFAPLAHHEQFAGVIPVTVLKHHFNVSNSYVIYKLRLIIFPWHHKPWARKIRRRDWSQSGSLLATISIIVIYTYYVCWAQPYKPSYLSMRSLQTPYPYCVPSAHWSFPTRLPL
ncbi:uncharacterized protein BJ212DRAFT_830746 [Suillus subaureus]|uniref:Protein YIF1 n=1 Tax=Suillus subaureus TaxID=48587 RepID=A0A9P7EIH7_9AGAM|nr:uncharacterized protein BJ212DRAFT_830746 [Suillus subaureus]KAG1822833.1 hypothetical protein BJ212DRAFT_830746 [Suillus subaureus]